MVSRGEVWWAQSPGGKRRPYLVLTRDAAIGVLHRVHAVPATRTVRGIPTEVEVGPEDGMPEACALSVDNLQLLDVDLLHRRICTLGPERMAAVAQALRISVDC